MFNQKKYDAARKFLQQSAEAQPDSPETLYLLSLSYLAENKSAAAFSLVESTLKHKPDWAVGYAVGGQLAALAGRNAQSETYFRKAVAIDPQLIAAWQGLGLVLSAESKYEDALDAFNKVIELSPRSASAYFSVAQVKDLQGKWDQAQAAYKQSLDLDPENTVAKNNLAWSYAEHEGNIDVALRLAQEASQAKPDDPAFCDTLGWIYVKKNTLGSAIQQLQRSVSLLPNNPEYSYHLGVAYMRAGDKAKAKESLETTLHLEPNSSFAPDARKMLVSLKN
jgi:tetratricopeptide (TPR) repeat protein